MTKVKQFIEIIIPNIVKWKLNLDIYIELNKVNKYRNCQYHKSKQEIKDILDNIKNMSKENITKLNINDKLLSNIDIIVELIE